MKTAYLIGTNNLEKYDYEEIKKYDVKIIVVGTAKSFSLKREFLSAKDIEFLQVNTIPFEDKSIEVFDDNDVINKISDHLRSDYDNYIYTCDEKYILTAAKVRDALGITGVSYQESLLYRDKFLMKSYLLEKGLDLPKFFDMSQNIPTYNELSGFLASEKIILKPKDLGGSHGVVKIINEIEYNAFLSSYNKDFKYMAEPFIEGDLFHFDAIINNGIIYPFICEYSIPNKLFVDGFMFSSIPIHYKDTKYIKIKNYAIDILNKLKTKNSVIHMEIFYDYVTQNATFLEVGLRPPGAYIPKLYKNNYKINIYNQHLYANLNILQKLDLYENEVNSIVGFLPYIDNANNITIPIFRTKFYLEVLNAKNRSYTGNIGSILGEFTLEGENSLLKKDFLKLKNYKIYR